jgi:hypothetical protein
LRKNSLALSISANWAAMVKDSMGSRFIPLKF